MRHGHQSGDDVRMEHGMWKEMEMDEGNSEIDMQKLPQVSEVRLLFCFFFSAAEPGGIMMMHAYNIGIIEPRLLSAWLPDTYTMMKATTEWTRISLQKDARRTLDCRLTMNSRLYWALYWWDYL
jgi:hypothetical protein